MRKLFILCLTILIIFGCDEIFGTDDDVDLRIHITNFGKIGDRGFQKGYVENHSGPSVSGVKVQWSTTKDSGTSKCSPSTLDKGDKGYYSISYSGSGIKTEVIYF